MLSALKKVLSGIVPEGELENAGAEQALLENEDGSMSVVTAEMFAELSAKMDGAVKTLSEKDSVIASLTEKLAGFETLAAEMQAKADALAAEAKAKELSEKKELLASVLGSQNEKLEAVFESMKDLPSAAFEVVVGGMKASFDEKEKSQMFTEIGVEGKAEVAADNSKTLDISRFINKKK